MEGAFLTTTSEIISKRNFADEINYPTLFWLFLFGSIIGFLLEGIWCVLRTGQWESHPATVWGPFCVIYGFGAVAIYLVSILFQNHNLLVQFLLFSAAGSIVEYISSVFQELAFGTASWNYSRHFFNIGGRISLHMTFIWGMLGVLFSRFVFPRLVRIFGAMTGRFWQVSCIVLSVFMAVDLMISAAALHRWKTRTINQTTAANGFEQLLDKRFDDKAMKKRYPNMRFLTGKEKVLNTTTE